MNILVDIIVIAILLACVFLGYKRGLIGVIIKFFSFLIAIIISLVLFKPISYFVISHTEIDDHLRSTIAQWVEGEQSSTESDIHSSDSFLPTVISNYINTAVDTATKEAQSNIAGIVAENLTITIINVGVMIVLFLLTRVILIFIKIISDALTELPIIKQFNTSGGILYGILQGLLIIYIGFTIISLFVPIDSVHQVISSSYIGSFFYNHNLILLFFFKK